ncbi:UNVERIFIED_CONTAM: hypothetical protein Slati_2678500 [Sesamum latifolium]|uniref:Transposase MuDR plant domain-containing protein n=1 Tax=Sesamum latifolium TaxID=2727402 RepID=A0AAW2VZJ4_9LAMI
MSEEEREDCNEDGREEGEDCDEDSSTEEGEGSHQEGEENNSGDELSSYKSDDHCESENKSDSEFEDDVMHGALSRDASIFPNELEEKVKLEKGMVFVDIDAFRTVLREYVIQDGFQIMRLRNEKTRVTAHCASKDYPWRIHASPLADGVTFQIKTCFYHTCVRSDLTKLASAIWIA